MRWHLFAIGKPKLEFARAGMKEYAARLKPFAPVTISYVKSSTLDGESRALLERSEGMFRVVLDPRGEEIESRALAAKFADWQQRSRRDVALLIGGAEGHNHDVRRAAGWVWSLSKLTLQHEVALVVALEQLYRAYSINAGLPYHRD